VGSFLLQGETVPATGSSLIANRADSIAARIAARTAAAPNQIAIVDGNVQLTYGEIERQSNLLAARLQEAGACQDRCIGLFLERSAQFIVAALAVMKSGAAYIPLDPSTPADRVVRDLADAGAIVLLTNSRKAQSLPAGPWRVIELDIPSTMRPIAFANRETDPKSLAYVIYTSGSTGQPKGVEITHASLCSLIDWHQSAFRVSAADRASQVAGLGFDAAVWEIWPYLTAGASLHIADEMTRRSSQALRDWIVTEKITISFVPTALAEQLLRTSWPAETALRLLLTGGDTLHRRPLAGLPFLVVNNYGPTECTVVATSGIVSPDGDAGRPSIGRPIANATALILDDELRPVVPGEVGELCIGGALVGRGYRNQRLLTANRFVTYVSASGESLRIYRTGDRARLLENGEIDFLGRLDDQVKIRGYRIELGEIVECLNSFAGIEASIVSVLDVGDAGPSLVAYVVPTRDARLTGSDLRDFLASRLPEYMIPPFFVSIPALPVMANGKLDKSALPAPGVDNLLPSGLAVNAAPSESNRLQQHISALVASLLGRPSIEAEDNFFMVGGHSMLGVQLVARIRDVFGVKLTLRQLFNAPTVAGLSAEVARLTKPQ
jgi:amino acid adenylation domain-containing protein